MNDHIDVSYLTDRIAIMGGFYENDTLSNVRSHFKARHENHHTIYNFSSEPDYNIEQDLEHVHTYPFNGNNPCALKTLIAICCDIDSYLSVHHQNIAFLHCRTGLGRSCMIAACYLLHSGVFTSAAKSIEFVNKKRRPDTMDAITNPSQIRYVHYYEALLRSDSVQCGTYRVKHIRIRTVPSFSSSLIDCGCSPTVAFSVLARPNSNQPDVPWYPKRVFNQIDHMLDVKPRHYSSDREVQIDIPLERYNVHVRGDVCLGLFSEGDKMCQLYFHTGFIKDSILTFEKNVIDMAAADAFHYTFNEALKIEVCLEAIPDDPSLNLLVVKKKELFNHNGGAVVESIDWDFVHSYGDTNIPDVDDTDDHQ